MSVRRARHTPASGSPGRRLRRVTVPVAGGVHAGIPPQDLPPGFTPEARNVFPFGDSKIAPRSGLSNTEGFVFDSAILGAKEVFDVEGKSAVVAPSANTVYFRHPDNYSWSSLSYVPGTVASAMTDVLSGTSTDYFRATSIYDQNTENFIAVLSNNTNAVKFFSVTSGTTTFSDFTWIDSLDSMKKAKDVTSVNDRLVFFNTESSAGTRFPTRVYWSARGNPTDFLITSEAGFEDIMDMRGSGTAAVRFRDFLLLFTEYEVWRATPTLDSYAFRFDRVVDFVGCPWPKTIAVVPEGVIFLGRDREIYITDGSSVAPLGPVGGEGPSRIQPILEGASLLERAWSVFNHTKYRYEIYYVSAETAGGYPDRALFYDLRARTWWPQRFPFGVSSGADSDIPGDAVTYDEVSATYDSIMLAYDDYGVASGERAVNVFSSGGTAFRFRDASTDDDGTSIDWRWRSSGIRTPDHRKLHLTEVFVDYDANSSSSATLYVGDARNESDFDAGTALSITSTNAPNFTPTWKTSHAPNIEVRGSDGGRPKISSFYLTLKDASRF